MLSYDEMEVGYERGYDPPQASPTPSTQKTFPHETPGVTYWAQDKVAGRPAQSSPPVTFDPSPDAPKVKPNKPAAGETPPLPPPPGAAPGPAKPKGFQNAHVTETGKKYPPQAAVATAHLEAARIHPPGNYFTAVPEPKTKDGQVKYYEKISSSDSATLVQNYHEGTIQQEITYFSSQGVSPQVAYDNLKAKGLIPEDAKPDDPNNWSKPLKFPPAAKDVKVDKLNSAVGDFEAMKSEGLGPAAGRDQQVRENTERVSLTEQWIDEYQAAGSDHTREKAEGILEQMQPPLMQNGRVTNFDLAQARQNLYGIGRDGFPEANLPVANGKNQVSVAASKVDKRDKAYADINTKLHKLPLQEGEQQALLSSRTSLGGPLVDDGKLRDDVTPDQLTRYSQALDERTDSIGEMETRRKDLQAKLDPKLNPNISESRKASLEKNIERLDHQIDKGRRTIANNLRTETADYYRGEMPALLKKSGLSDEQIVQYMNGRGYLGDNPDLTKMSADYNHLRGMKSPQEFAGVKKDVLKENTEAGYPSKITGDSPEARRGQDILVGLSKQPGGYARGAGGAGGAGGKVEDQMTLADHQQQLQHETMEFEDEIAQKKEARALNTEVEKMEMQEEFTMRQEDRLKEKELEFKELDFEYSKKSAAVQAGWTMLTQTLGTTYQSLMQGLMAQTEASNRRLEAESQRSPITAMQQGIANSLYPARR